MDEVRIRLRLKKRVGPIHAGELCGELEDRAIDLVKNGNAEFVNAEDAEKYAARVASDPPEEDLASSESSAPAGSTKRRGGKRKAAKKKSEA